MAEPALEQKITYAEYLEQEEKAFEKHEYVHGVIYAMSGGTSDHGRIAASMIIQLGTALRGRPCNVYSSDVRIRIVETDMATYPDTSVVCGKLEHAVDDRHGVVNPLLIVEVLSDSTEAYDRGAKAAHYRRIPSLKEYVLVNQKSQKIEVYRRFEHNRWEFSEYGPGEQAVILETNLSVDAVYYDAMALPNS